MFERCVHIIMMYVGAKCAFTSGDIRKIMDELTLARLGVGRNEQFLEKKNFFFYFIKSER